ncbi:phosphomannomutase/phosphoglucomutase [Porticoccus sp. W117]|uniref:phosphomannomutase/phosphoglucomutase n=1 Tax=Porticoccus sp. W117 TaxID=3054777 RepID=UPI0025961CC3|nr:phosphomannomutase/phosphoglucomutase [Porticoccus sp. W117]MDM3870539.1 phosphomannomutase/phosphoglucomutase [Porticoccus sp. W117]
MADTKTRKSLLKTNTPLALWGAIALFVLMLFACYHLYTTIVADPAQKRALSLAQQGSSYAARTTDRFITDQQQQLQSLAARPLTAMALKASDNDRRKLEQSVTELMHGAAYSRLITSADTGNARKLNFVALDLARRVLNGESVSPEAMLMERQWHILMATQVNSSEQQDVIGCLLVSFPASHLAGLLADSGVDGQVKLTQHLAGTPSRAFITQGNAEHNSPSHQIGSKLPHWKVAFKPSLKQLQASDTELWLFYSVLAVTLLIGAWVGTRLAVQRGMEIKAKQDNRRKQQQQEDEEIASATSFLSTIPSASSNKEPAQEPQSEEKQGADGDVFDLAEDKGKKAAADPITAEQLPEEIFRAYDIRGVYGKQVTEQLATHLGQALGSLAQEQGENTLVVAHDGRTSSPGLYRALIKGIRASGCNLIALGQGPTPLTNFAINHLEETSSGVTVTASHNPPEYNGFKMSIKGKPLTPEQINGLRTRILEQDYLSGSGRESQLDLVEDYIERIVDDAVPADELKVVVDASNGVTGPIAPQLLEQMGCEVSPLNCEVDGTFPSHPPDTSVAANLQDLIQMVKHQEADLGLAFDGDGDRITAVTASGRIVWPDELMMIFARDVLSRQPGADIVFDVKSTRRLNALIGNYGGRPVIWKTGHSFMREKVSELDAPLGGEYSGHIFFNDRWYGFDDGMYAAARLVEIISLREQSLDDIYDTLPNAEASPEYRVQVPEQEKFALVEALADSDAFEDCKLITVDGLRVEDGDSWGLVRASNTSAEITLRFEGSDKENMLAMAERIKNELLGLKPDLSIDF